jgi:hypothetical protein
MDEVIKRMLNYASLNLSKELKMKNLGNISIRINLIIRKEKIKHP